MKKVIALIMSAVVLCLALVGCSEKKEGMTLGEWKNNTYSNEYLNLKFTLSNDWKIFSDEEIAQMAGLQTEEGATDIKDAILKKQEELMTIFAMSAQRREPQGVSQVSVYYENLELSNGTGYDVNQYADAMLTNMVDAGINATEISRETKQIAGGEYLCVKIAFDYGIGTKVISEYNIRRIDNYMAFIMFNYAENNRGFIDELEKNISVMK